MSFSPWPTLLASQRALPCPWPHFLPHGIFEDLALLLIALLCFL